MKRRWQDLSEEEFVKTLIEAGRSDLPSEQAIASTLHAIGAVAPVAPATGIAWLWKVLATVVLTPGVGAIAWALWPSEAPRALTPVAVTGAPPAASALPPAPVTPLPPLEAAPPAPQASTSGTSSTTAARSAPPPAAAATGANPTATASPGTKPKADRLLAEVRALDDVRAAIRQGQAVRALGLLDSFARDFPAPVLGNEARVLKIEALANSGNRTAARQLGEQYLLEIPNGPLSNRVRAIIGRP